MPCRVWVSKNPIFFKENTNFFHQSDANINCLLLQSTILQIFFLFFFVGGWGN
jgi:hypothetical protein